MSKAAEFAVILKMNPMFADLGADELQRISSLCHTQNLGVGEMLFQKGDPGNALFGVRRGQIRIETGAFGDRVDLRIVDRGPGIPMAMREHVFAPFQRLDDTSAGTGVGLGLAVARGFVQAMRGTVEIEDTAGGGATVVISLPAGAGVAATGTETARSSHER